MNFFRKKTNYGKIVAVTIACVAAASAIAFVVYKLVEKYRNETIYDDLLDDCDCDCGCCFDEEDDDVIEAIDAE